MGERRHRPVSGESETDNADSGARGEAMMLPGVGLCPRLQG
jgi:hypothetical protein